MYTQQDAAIAAERAAEALRNQFPELANRTPSTAVILGMGWGAAIEAGALFVPLKTHVPGFEQLGELSGHARRIGCVEIGGELVLVQQGRVHLNEAFPGQEFEVNAMARLQVEMAVLLGAKKFVLTAAVGGLGGAVSVGDLVIIESLLSLYAPPFPLFGGEFCSPEDVLSDVLAREATLAFADRALPYRAGICHAMVRGPNFEGRKKDKGVLQGNRRNRSHGSSVGADVVGMSIQPELAVIAACSTNERPLCALALGFVTNNDAEAHSHSVNQERALKYADRMSRGLRETLERIVAL